MIASPNTVQYIGNVLCYICIQSRLKLFVVTTWNGLYLYIYMNVCLQIIYIVF